MIALCLAWILTSISAEKAHPLRIAVLAPGDVTDSLLTHVCGEATTIWAPAGIALECHRIGSAAEAGTWPLAVTIDDHSSNLVPAGTLGWITFTANRPDRLIHLSRARAEDLLCDSPGLNDPTVASHETLIGRALGRGLAHELGHYLLRTRAHTSRGLMRPAWTSDDSFALTRVGLELTPEQREAAFGYLASKEQAPATDRGHGVD
jgi:hypothetical protein